METRESTAVLIPAEEVALMLGVSERTLWRLLSAGKVPEPLRIGRNTRWRAAEVREWIERGCPNRRPGANSALNV